jgi:hypothetical protein
LTSASASGVPFWVPLVYWAAFIVGGAVLGGLLNLLVERL